LVVREARVEPTIVSPARIAPRPAVVPAIVLPSVATPPPPAPVPATSEPSAEAPVQRGADTVAGAEPAHVGERPAAPQKVLAEVAPAWRRLLAWGADLAALALVAWLFLLLATALVHHGSPSRQSGLDWLAETLLAYRKLWVPGGLLVSLLAILYLTLFTALGGQTPGKWLLGLRVIDRSGGCPSPLRSAARAALAVGSAVLGLLGFFVMFLDRRGQALHDKLAGTFVVLGP
jgi:uncharacterized RDD family membrane protein YckC